MIKEAESSNPDILNEAGLTGERGGFNCLNQARAPLH